ncbi:hypothetical protein [Natronococcus sp. A-GB7]|uniref:hypothetical protein n=1 Tax=Natronococcus sp. A-GB7 TaxID=3037649 RepID=UPI00241EE92C|nr:hypothetical protein [Natronococcus sp. A-GB7]MDG5819614.1 hypothetical protein [Natronococcus sp. A-GB7]
MRKESYDRVFEALASEQRRRILFALLDEPLSLEGDGGSLTGERAIPDAVLLERRHIHLPKLEDYGFVRWNPEREGVEKGPQFEEIEPVLALLADQQPELLVGPHR